MPDQPFLVTTSMTVPVLKQSLARLMQISTPLVLFVAPRWELLDHDGYIVPRFLPDLVTPCPHLGPDSFIRVCSDDFGLFARSRLVGSSQRLHSSDDFGLFACARLDGSLDNPSSSFGASPFSASRLDSSLANSSSSFGPSPFSASRLVSSSRPDNLVSNQSQTIARGASAPSLHGGFAPSLGNLRRNGENAVHESVSSDLPSMEQHTSSLFAYNSFFPPEREEERRRHYAAMMARTSNEKEDTNPPSKRLRSDGSQGSDSPPPDVSLRADESLGSDSHRAGESLGSDSLRAGESLRSDSPPSGKMTETDTIQVSRRERRIILVKKFRNEQRLDRRRYRLKVRAMWDTEIADGKENRQLQDDTAGESSSTQLPVDPEIEAEAYENYSFDRMMAYDEDAAHLLVAFRESLQVVPDEDPRHTADALRSNNRTAALWEGLRRVYFGELEREPSAPPEQELSRQEIIENLRKEIEELEERLRVGRRGSMNTGRLLHLPRRDDDDNPPSAIAHTNGESCEFLATPYDLVYGSPTSVSNDEGSERHDSTRVECSPGTSKTTDSSESLPIVSPIRKLVLISKRVLRRVMAAKESLFKFGTFVPRNDREAESSPEAARWKAGRSLEWVRLCKEGTFDGNWTLEKLQETLPSYKKSDIGFLFYVYDFKFSGKYQVRLVFDGSRQSASTYKVTYAPTVRAESVRLFHIFCVEEGLHIGQYDVPQAFLKADIDHDIFVYPSKGQSDFPGQILKLRKALYGGKQSAFLWFTLINTFLLSLGFTPSPLDSCFYRRFDAVLILYCDDLRIGASPEVLVSLHASLSEKFSVTTAPGDRFLGMDTTYDPKLGILKLSMKSYIETTKERFSNFDLKQGYPYRELVGCLLWVTLNVRGQSFSESKTWLVCLILMGRMITIWHSRCCKEFTFDDIMGL